MTVVQLLVMRHAKSDWTATYDDDHERPLAPRGVKAARRMGRFLTATGHQPDLAISSTAVRARTTVELAAEAGDWTCPVSLAGDLYFGGTDSVLECLADRDAAPRILVAGHEPTWSALVAVLTGGGRVRMPTAAVACIDFGAASWSNLRPGTGQLQWVVTPKLLQRAMRGCSGDVEL